MAWSECKRERHLLDMEEKFFDIVQYARSGSPARAAKIAEKRPDMVAELQSCPDNWRHGFNSGCLAAFRLALAVAFGSTLEIEREIESFPNLDT